MNIAAFTTWIPATLLVLTCHLPVAHAQQTVTVSEKLHANALSSFRQGRFSEAYGRLVHLADTGYAPSAQLALWMYLHSTSVFGNDWDSTPEQLQTWAAVAGQTTPTMTATYYPRKLTPVSDRKR